MVSSRVSRLVSRGFEGACLKYSKYRRFWAGASKLHNVLLCYALGPFGGPRRQGCLRESMYVNPEPAPTGQASVERESAPARKHSVPRLTPGFARVRVSRWICGGKGGAQTNKQASKHANTQTKVFFFSETSLPVVL